MQEIQFDIAAAAPGAKAGSGGLSEWRIRRLEAFVGAHLSQPIRSAELSALVGLGVTHFTRAFGRSFGRPPHVYVIHRRLGRACHLMLSSDMPLGEVALACGFSDQAHFCRLFRREMGRTPTAWRRDRRAATRAVGSASAPSCIIGYNCPDLGRTHETGAVGH